MSPCSTQRVEEQGITFLSTPDNLILLDSVLLISNIKITTI